MNGIKHYKFVMVETLSTPNPNILVAQISCSVVIGSPADQYMCKKKARTEADFSAGLLARPE